MNGLSPPTRGNPARMMRSNSASGSIPAHAGEPPYDMLVVDEAKVYPRPRGGTCR